MQEPIRAADNSSFQPCSFTNVPNLDNGVARSGVNGPLMVGSSSERFCYAEVLSMMLKKCHERRAHDFNDLVVFGTFVGSKIPVCCGFVCSMSDGRASRSLEVCAHARGIRESRSRSANLSTHVRHGRKACR